MPRLPLKAELTAATSVAAKAGLGVVAPEVLHIGSHTSARLAPWPIVARIASGTSFDFLQCGLERELKIARHLASMSAPSVRPATQMPPGPYVESDCAITLWEFVEGRAVAMVADELLAALSLEIVHSALAEVNADLPSFITKIETCQTILTNPAQAPKLEAGDRLFLERLYETLRAKLVGVGDSWQALHGDTHLGNVLITSSGAIWMDLEATCVGPLEWDVANLPVATWPAFRRLDIALLRLFADVRNLCVTVWCWADFDRSPMTAEAATYHLHQLKARFS